MAYPLSMQHTSGQLLNILPRVAATAAVHSIAPTHSSTVSSISPMATSHTDPNGTSVVVGILPFYASSSALIYVASMCTALSWFLVMMLLITPGHFLGFPMGRNPIWLQARDLPQSISTRPDALISGSRPWLQKAAALLVAISMTIASADILSFVRDQYYRGYINPAEVLTDLSTTLLVQVFRIISYIFLLLAQVQTLIRLFPRQKEKLIIKWFGFFLILLDLIFSLLDSFWIKHNFIASPNWKLSPVDYVDAISALSYLFQLALALLYAAWVLYYIGTKRRYAFFSKKMPNVTLIAILAILSVIIPIAFFVVDIAVQNTYGWGDFLRWSGGVAASVVVWEWVERIEALEQDEKKDGILGREVFDEDETLGRPANSSVWPSQSRVDSHGDSGRSSSSRSSTDPKWQARSFGQFLGKLRPATADSQSSFDVNLEKQPQHSTQRRRRWFRSASTARKTQVPHDATPISRTDTTSAVSTEYAVHYHPVTITPPVKERIRPITSNGDVTAHVDGAENSSNHDFAINETQESGKMQRLIQFEIPKVKPASRRTWVSAPNPFKRRKESPPLEIKQAMSLNPSNDSEGNMSATFIPAASRNETQESPPTSPKSSSRYRRSQFKILSSSKAEPTVIPAPARGHVWAPGQLSHSAAIPETGSGPSQHGPDSEGAAESDRTMVNEDSTSTFERNRSSRSGDEASSRPFNAEINTRTNPGFVLSPVDLGDPRPSQDED